MADWSHHLQSPYLHKTPPSKTFFFLSPPPHLHFHFPRFPPLRRNLSLSSSSSKHSSSTNNLLIISTSEQSDGSFVFKFGDESDIIQDNVGVVEDSADVSAKSKDNDHSVVDAQCGSESANLLQIVKDDDDSDFGYVDAQYSKGGGSVDNSSESLRLYDDVDAKPSQDSALDAQSGGISVDFQDSTANLLEFVKDNGVSDVVDPQSSGDFTEADNLPGIVKDNDDFDVVDAQVKVEDSAGVVIEHDSSAVDSQTSGDSSENNVTEILDSGDTSDNGGVTATAEHASAEVIEEDLSGESKADSGLIVMNVEDLDTVMTVDHSNVDVTEESSDDSKAESSESVMDVKYLDTVMTVDHSNVNVIEEELSDDSKVEIIESVMDVKDDFDAVMAVDHSHINVIEEESSDESTESVTDVKDLDTVMAVDHSDVNAIGEESSDDSKVGSKENVSKLEDMDAVVPSEENEVIEDDVVEEIVELVTFKMDEKVKEVEGEDDVVEEMVELATFEMDEKVKDVEGEDDVVEEMVELVTVEMDEKVNVVEGEDDVVEEMVELVELPVQIQAEPIIDEEVSSNLADDIVALDSGLASEEVNSAAIPSILQFQDDPHSSDVSELGDSGLHTSGVACSEPSLDSAKTSTIMLPMPSAETSSLHSLEVNDAAVATLVQSDDDLSRDISIVADLGTSETSAESSLNRLNETEISVPLLFLESATASLTSSAEVLAGGEDAYFLNDNWFGVADGVGQWSFEGIDKGLYAREFVLNCEKLAQKNQNAGLTNVKLLLQQSAEMTECTGSARVLVAHFVNQALHVANVGDSGFVVIRNGVVFKKSSPLIHEFNFPYAICSSDKAVEAVEEYHVELEDGDFVVTATDGLFDNLYEQEIASIASKAVESGKSLQDIAELLATKAQEVGTSAHARTPFADAAQAAGHAGVNGGKFDHVTVIVSMVQRR